MHIVYKTLILMTGLLLSVSVHAKDQPAEIKALQEALSAVPGIFVLGIIPAQFSSANIEQFEDMLWLGNAADLPIVAFRRSDGNLKNEVLIQAYFKIEPSGKGLKGLEFISWWASDEAAEGSNFQIRSLGSSPIANDEVRLGATLRFSLDMFITTRDGKQAQVLTEVNTAAKLLKAQLKEYQRAFK